MMPYDIHQQELWIQICQAVNSRPDAQWTLDRIAEELGIPVGSPGYDRIREVIDAVEVAQSTERQKITVGFK
jgi:hypothetical protein